MDTPTLGEAAIAYARAGWSVIPVHGIVAGRCTCGRPDCPAPGKHPRIRWRLAMTRRPTPEEVAAWWRRWPESNVGVVTGMVSELAVVDVDPRNGGDETLDQLEAGYGPLPDTVTSLTGGGGHHLWFSAEDLPVPSTLLGTGAELKAEGGMVVAPPSRHVSGGVYRWARGAAPGQHRIVPLPPWLRGIAHGSFRKGRRDEAAPVRTEAERQEFAEAWARAGVTVVPGDNAYLCPFHDDHHPSLHIDAEGCRWYCFACRIGGGIGALRRMLGEEPPRRLRRRIRGWVGPHRRVTLTGDEEIDVVGESRHQDELLELTGGRRSYAGVEMDGIAELVPDVDDPLDVTVLLAGRPVGWLRRADADALRPVIEDALDRFGAATCRAQIRGGWDRGDGDVGMFGVVLFCDRD